MQSSIKTAVIDIGTLKIKFEICEFDSNFNFKTLYKEKYLTVLGRDLDKTNNMIIEKSVIKAINALKECKKKLEEYDVKLLKVVATDALRKAKNGDDVRKRIIDATGFTPQILSDREEGEIFFKALTKDFTDKTLCAVDVGGGSVQVIIGNKQEILFNKSFKTGTYYMQENFSDSHHPTEKELENAKKYIAKEMRELRNIKLNIDKVVYGSTNIIDFFKAMQIDMKNNKKYKDHPFSVNLERLKDLYEKIIAKSYEDRMEMFPAEPYYMWAADKALMNIFEVCKCLNVKNVIPTNYNISTGLHYLLALSNEKNNCSNRS